MSKNLPKGQFAMALSLISCSSWSGTGTGLKSRTSRVGSQPSGRKLACSFSDARSQPFPSSPGLHKTHFQDIRYLAPAFPKQGQQPPATVNRIIMNQAMECVVEQVYVTVACCHVAHLPGDSKNKTCPAHQQDRKSANGICARPAWPL